VIGKHRADIRRCDGFVIELQHSSISVEDIEAREAFYGNMCWLLDVELLGKVLFLMRSERDIRMRWFNADRRTLTRARKPIFCDLGGPIVEF
jgi:competence CoiA-like predicted nuclease